MLTFEPFSLSALRKFIRYIKSNPSLCSDISAGFLFMWHDGADVQFCEWNGTFTVRQIIGEQPAFSYPIGNDPDGMICEIKDYARSNRLPMRFFAVDKNTLEIILSDPRLSPAMFAFDRRWSDYIYSFEEAMTFQGKKYSGQRNHINKFKKLYGEPDIRFLTENDKPEVEKMLKEYEKEHPDGNAIERIELEKTKELFDVFQELGLFAAGLFVNGVLAAFSIGEVVGDTLIIDVEKALTCYEGIYPTMYSGFVNLISERSGGPLKFVNREDDSGDPGLRTSKLQYHPVSIVDKYLVHVSSPAVRAKKTVTLRCGDIYLTEFRETDKQAYLRLNTDIENNRFWGYDYREDETITGPVDENTFYDSVMYDMQAGDSVNLAVRLSENGEMIGEAILWNFTSVSTAELGCRILPEYHGKGYGKAAFGAAARYAEEILNVTLIARCNIDNTASERMISANGFLPLYDEKEYRYFIRKPAVNECVPVCSYSLCSQ